MRTGAISDDILTINFEALETVNPVEIEQIRSELRSDQAAQVSEIDGKKVVQIMLPSPSPRIDDVSATLQLHDIDLMS